MALITPRLSQTSIFTCTSVLFSPTQCNLTCGLPKKCIYHLSGEHITTLSHLSFTSLSPAFFLSPSLLMHILHAKEQQCLSTIRSGICGSSLRAFDWLIHVKLNTEEEDVSSCFAFSMAALAFKEDTRLQRVPEKRVRFEFFTPKMAACVWEALKILEILLWVKYNVCEIQNYLTLFEP